MNPDNFSGVYHKGLRPNQQRFSGGGNPAKVSGKVARNIGRLFLTIIVSFWGLAICVLLLDGINPGVIWNTSYADLVKGSLGGLFFYQLSQLFPFSSEK